MKSRWELDNDSVVFYIKDESQIKIGAFAMKRLALIALGVIAIFNLSFAQFKEQAEAKPNVYESIVQNSSGRLYFGFFNPANLFMRHSISVSYINIGGKGMMINTYTNSLLYKFSDNLNLQADISLVNSPFNPFGKGFNSAINGIFLNRLELNYRPTQNMLINLQFRQMPFYEYYYPYLR